MRYSSTRRTQGIDLLARPPCGASAGQEWAALVVDPVEQVEELVDLRGRGLLTDEQYERQMEKLWRDY
jgi:myo-inositol catabolism protein IolC